MVNQLLLTHRASAMQEQVFQYAGLLPCECQHLTGGSSGAGLGIKAECPAGQDHVILRELPQGQTAYPRLQLCQMKGLGKVIVGAGIQPRHFVGDLTACRKDQHPRVPIRLAERAQDRHAIGTGQIQIKQYEVIPLHAEQTECLLPVMAIIHTVCKTAQTADDSLAERTLILNDQNMHRKALLACVSQFLRPYYNTKM